MAVNRVDFGGNTLIDLTGDTLESAEQLLKGIIAHAKDGAIIEGTLEAGGGGFQVALGTFIPAETKSLNSIPPISIEHNAGFTPDAFIFYKASTGTYGIIAVSAKATILWGEESINRYSCYVMAKGSPTMGQGTLKGYPPTGDVVYIRSDVSSHKVTAGQEYRWIAIGGI